MVSCPLWARQAALAATLVRRCRPLARAELARWAQRAATIPDPDIRRHALASLARKGFHCEGGAVYAAATPALAPTLVRAIVALQTLVDVLDNLSDRAGPVTEAGLSRLHAAVAHALTPGAPAGDYTGGADGGYLAALVGQVQGCLAALPGYPAVAAACQELGRRYTELQVRKHLPSQGERVRSLLDWLSPWLARYPGWQWWELAAACGSTLGIFALLAAAVRPGAPGARQVLAAYFPWVCAFHILLDYFIDQDEDRRGGDLNFVALYRDPRAALAGLRRIQAGALAAVQRLPDAALHRLVVAGLPGLYLSDPKVAAQGLLVPAWRLVWAGGPLSLGAYLYCRAAPPLR